MTGACDRDTLLEAKRLGFTDDVIANDVGVSEASIKNLRRMWHITPSFSIVDTCAAEFKAETPYYYSDYCVENEVESPRASTLRTSGARPRSPTTSSGPSSKMRPARSSGMTPGRIPERGRELRVN